MSSSGGDSDIDAEGLVKNFGNPADADDNSGFDGSIENALMWGIGGVIAAIFIAINMTIDAVISLVVDPIFQLATSASNNVEAIVGGSADVINKGVKTTVESISPGATWAIGPLTWLLSIALMGAALFLLAEILQRAPTSNLVPFTRVDIPFLGADEEE